MVQSKGGYEKKLEDHFVQVVTVDELTCFLKIEDPGLKGSRQLEPQALECRPVYLQAFHNHKSMRIKVYVTPWTNPSIWLELRRFHTVLGQNVGGNDAIHQQ